MKSIDKEESKFELFRVKLIEDSNSTPISGIFASIKGGLSGFFIVLTLVIFTKTLSILAEHSTSISISINDFILSMWGFFIFSFVIFISKNKK